MNEIELGLLDHLLLILLGIFLPLLAVFQSQSQLKGIEFNTSMKKQVYYGNSIFQWICAFGILIVWWVYDRYMEDLGLVIPEMNPVTWTLLLTFIFLYAVDVWWELRNSQKIEETRSRWLKDVPFLPVNFNELKHFAFVAITAGVCEEIIFRGFFINYFLAWNADNLMGKWLAVIIPAFLFSFGHMYQGHKAVAKTMLMAVLFGWMYILSKSILLLIIIHFLVDILGGYLAMKILSEGNKSSI